MTPVNSLPAVEELMFKARRVVDLDRDELLHVVQWAYAEIAKMRRWHAEDEEMQRLFDDTRRAIGHVR